ncbi:hypothetical protein Tco_1264219 [Tanacetum coccineum]
MCKSTVDNRVYESRQECSETLINRVSTRQTCDVELDVTFILTLMVEVAIVHVQCSEILRGMCIIIEIRVDVVTNECDVEYVSALIDNGVSLRCDIDAAFKVRYQSSEVMQSVLDSGVQTWRISRGMFLKTCNGSQIYFNTVVLGVRSRGGVRYTGRSIGLSAQTHQDRLGKLGGTLVTIECSVCVWHTLIYGLRDTEQSLAHTCVGAMVIPGQERSAAWSDSDWTHSEDYGDRSISSVRRFLALGWHLEEIHATWAHLEKKRTRLRTYTKSHEESCSQSVETASQA